jgi:hypothetical protein
MLKVKKMEKELTVCCGFEIPRTGVSLILMFFKYKDPAGSLILIFLNTWNQLVLGF